ncbi:MAG: hypothetical protein GX469_03705 [Treponema sp.]|nr:hypothetical protein [Treponema sp.]
MGKIGDLFREARLGKGLTLEQVADETNISKHFLQGIESDDFSDFPGEVYSLGFIRNYAEFLGLDASAMVEIYRSNESTRQAEVEKSESTELPLPVEDSKKEETLPQKSFISSEVEKSAKETKQTFHAKRKPKEKSIKREEPETIKAEPKASIQVDSTLEKAALIDFQPKKKIGTGNIRVGRVLPFVFVAIVLIIAAVSIIPRLRISPGAARVPTEYRAEGLPFEQRLYPQDKVYIPLSGDVISITLESIKDKVSFNTPFGSLAVGLNEKTVLDPSADRERLVIAVSDYEADKSQNGAMVHFDVEEALSDAENSLDIIVPSTPGKAQLSQDSTQGQAGGANRTQTSSTVLFRSTGGPHPFYVNVSFIAPVFFRYEADRKEWVEKYYRKGESITVNASNTITFWTANAQAVKVNVFQSAGKSVELVMGGPGEIAVQRLSWSNSQSGWAMIATQVD